MAFTTGGPYENRVISPRSPYNWYYTGGTENGAGDVLDDIYSGHVLLYESNECEVTVHRISGSEFGTIATVQLPPDDDTPPANVPPSCSIALDKTTGAVNTPFKISANAADPDGSVSRVEYYAGITKLGQTTAVPPRVDLDAGRDGQLRRQSHCLRQPLALGRVQRRCRYRHRHLQSRTAYRFHYGPCYRQSGYRHCSLSYGNERQRYDQQSGVFRQ
jgi:hypothetical protein